MDINRKRKSKHSHSSLSLHIPNNSIFPLILAAIFSSPPLPKSLILQCLHHFHHSLLSSSHLPFLLPFLSLFPSLLLSRCGGIARATAEILGASSLTSVEMNEAICSDEETLKALISLLGSSNRRLLLAACNAILDISTTSFGRRTLLHFSALNRIMWEGFAHVAVFYWSQTKLTPHDMLIKSLPESMLVMSVNMLHAAVEIIGAADPTFRKACLVAGMTLPLDKSDWLYLCQKNIFDSAIEKIDRSSGFFDILSRLERAAGKEDPFQRMRWLRVLFKEHNWDILGAMKNLLPLHVEHKHQAEAAFMHIKSKFCREVSLEDVVHSYKMVMEMYKKTRKQYTNGMLSLQGN